MFGGTMVLIHWPIPVCGDRPAACGRLGWHLASGHRVIDVIMLLKAHMFVAG